MLVHAGTMNRPLEEMLGHADERVNDSNFCLCDQAISSRQIYQC